MIRHIVLFNFKPETSDEDRRRAREAYLAMRDCEYIASIEWGDYTTSTSMRLSQRRYSHSGLMTFNSPEAFRAYAQHPLHKHFADNFHDLIEMGDAYYGDFDI